MSSEGTIDYETLMQDAMRGVVRRVLENTIRDGLPGDHHFYISFDTLAPGVVLSKRLRDKYAEEMTIVLQHRFWDLAVNEDFFEVKLTFDGIPERLVIPYKSIKVFFDPSVRYGLQFETVDMVSDGHPPAVVVERGDLDTFEHGKPGLAEPDHAPPAIAPLASIPAPGQDTAGDDNNMPAANETAPEDLPGKTLDEADTDAEEQSDEDGGSKVVSLDAFRKK